MRRLHETCFDVHAVVQDEGGVLGLFHGGGGDRGGIESGDDSG